MPLAESDVAYPVVPVAQLRPAVANAFVAAVDPDFYDSDNSLITRRYTVITTGSGEQSGLRTRIMAHKTTAGWEQLLDTMVERGWLSPAERTTLTFPA